MAQVNLLVILLTKKNTFYSSDIFLQYSRFLIKTTRDILANVCQIFAKRITASVLQRRLKDLQFVQTGAADLPSFGVNLHPIKNWKLISTARARRAG